MHQRVEHQYPWFFFKLHDWQEVLFGPPGGAGKNTKHVQVRVCQYRYGNMGNPYCHIPILPYMAIWVYGNKGVYHSDCTALVTTATPSTALHCTAPTALHCTAAWHHALVTTATPSTALHCTALHRLPCTAVQCPTNKQTFVQTSASTGVGRYISSHMPRITVKLYRWCAEYSLLGAIR